METKHIRLHAAIAVLCVHPSAWAQLSEADTIRGELHLNTPTIVHSSVLLDDLQGHHSFSAVNVGGDGTFVFHRVPYGEYRLTVLDSGDNPIHEELVSVRDKSQPIQVAVDLPETAHPAAGTVSAEELLHPPTKQAFRAFLAARKFADAGAHDKAAGQLEKAVQLSPDYLAAWVNLGAQHIFLKCYEQAIQELQRAGEISKPTAMMLGNIAYAQFALHRYNDGLRSAREALRLDPSYPQAHYLLGSFLVLNRRTLAEGLQHLEVAARAIPDVRPELERARRDAAQVMLHP